VTSVPMPKKFASVNTKAVEARERKENAKSSKALESKKAAEDAAWEDDDKMANKKALKKKEEEEKRRAALERKALAAEQLQLEEASMAKVTPKKLTQAELKARKEEERRLQEAERAEAEKEEPIPENMNHVMTDVDVAQTVEQAIAALDEGEGVDYHPEKRVKAAWRAFEEARLTQMRQENPSLKLSQIRQMLRKEWQKSPLNPMNK